MANAEAEVMVAEKSGHPGMLRRIAGYKIGPVPLTLYVILAAVIYTASVVGKLPADMIGGIAVLMIGGILLGHIGLTIPYVKDLGGAPILSNFVPCILVAYGLVNPNLMKAATAFMKGSNFLYFYVACLVTGSILGMQRVVLIQGFLRMFVPLLVGTLSSIVAGTGVGVLTGQGIRHSFFDIVMPILAGGVGEGILPLSMAYSEILHRPYSAFLPQLLPAALLGNVFAISSAGYLKRLGEKKPHLSGNGLLVKTREDNLILQEQNAQHAVDFHLMGAGLLLSMTFYIWGLLGNMLTHFPGPIIMIFTAATIKALGWMPEKMERGALQMYRFVATTLTWALMVGFGLVDMRWHEVVAAISLPYILVCAATVLAMITSGFFVGKLINMYPIEAAIVTGCHSGMGGSGDVAILSASNRMGLMPFAQVSTRLGGACVVVVATILLRIVAR